MSSSEFGDLPPGGAKAGPGISARDAGVSTAQRTPTTSAGFGSPSADTTVKRIDLNDAFIRHPEATYVMRAQGSAMAGAGIDSGDVLLVDRAIAPAHGHVVIAVYEGELVCRRLWRQEHGAGSGNGIWEVWLQAEAAPGHQTEPVPDIVLGPDQTLEVWGVVTMVVKSLLD